jgi:hypothetical protein
MYVKDTFSYLPEVTKQPNRDWCVAIERLIAPLILEPLKWVLISTNVIIKTKCQELYALIAIDINVHAICSWHWRKARLIKNAGFGFTAALSQICLSQSSTFVAAPCGNVECQFFECKVSERQNVECDRCWRNILSMFYIVESTSLSIVNIVEIIFCRCYKM